MHSAFTVEDLLALEVRNLYAAEKRPTRVLSRMHLGSRNPTLKSAFEDHSAETDQQVRRLEDIAGMLQFAPAGGQCEGMDGCVREADAAFEIDEDDPMLDPRVIGAGIRIEHCEIARYITAIGLARQLKAVDAAALLEHSRAEEHRMQVALCAISSALPRCVQAPQLRRAVLVRMQ